MRCVYHPAAEMREIPRRGTRSVWSRTSAVLDPPDPVRRDFRCPVPGCFFVATSTDAPEQTLPRPPRRNRT